MKPVDQTIFGFPSGNCFAACLASILEVPITDVPNFMEDHERWFELANAWCDERGYALLWVKADAVRCGYVDPRPLIDAGHYFIVSGQSPRGEHLHAVVQQFDKIVHDPHPSRAGIVGAWVDFLVPVPNTLTLSAPTMIPHGTPLGKFIDELRAERDVALAEAAVVVSHANESAARMDRFVAEFYPADAEGKLPFARVLIESVATELRDVAAGKREDES